MRLIMHENYLQLPLVLLNGNTDIHRPRKPVEDKKAKINSFSFDFEIDLKTMSWKENSFFYFVKTDMIKNWR